MARATAAESEPGAPVTEWARWNAWAGSPELLVHIARTTIRAMREGIAVSPTAPPSDEEIEFKALVFVDGDVELFDAPEAILTDATPEALSRCRRVDFVAHSKRIATTVKFLCRPIEFGFVEVKVSGTDRAVGDEVATVAAAVAMVIRRGFRRKIGGVEHSGNLLVEQVGTRAFFGYPFEHLGPGFVGCVTGAMFGFTVSAFFPDADLSPAVFSAASMVPMVAYPVWLRYTVPRVEFASEGKTRLRRVLTRSALGLAGLAVTIAVQLLVGTGA